MLTEPPGADAEAEDAAEPPAEEQPSSITDMLYGQSAPDPTADVQWDAFEAPGPSHAAAVSTRPAQIKIEAADGLDFREAGGAASDQPEDSDMPPFMQLLRGSDAETPATSGSTAHAQRRQSIPGTVGGELLCKQEPYLPADSSASASAGLDARQAGAAQAQASEVLRQPQSQRPVEAAALQLVKSEPESCPEALHGWPAQELAFSRTELRTVTQTRQGFRQEHRVRQLKTLFLRGGCVVLVNPVQDAGQHSLTYKQPRRQYGTNVQMA